MANYFLQPDRYRLITAEILYHMPDYQKLLQTFVWQEYDLAPRYPELTKFLDFWENNLDGPLHSVKVAQIGMGSAKEFLFASGELVLQ